MSYARDVLHDWIECDHVDDCRDVRRLITLVGDDRAHAEAQKLRAMAEGMPKYKAPAHGTTGRQVTLILADEIDPYEMRDGQLVRKSDGNAVTL